MSAPPPAPPPGDGDSGTTVEQPSWAGGDDPWTDPTEAAQRRARADARAADRVRRLRAEAERRARRPSRGGAASVPHRPHRPAPAKAVARPPATPPLADAAVDRTSRRWPIRVAIVAAVPMLIVGAAVTVLAWADHNAAGKIAKGVSVAGVDVGGLTEDQALQRLEQRIGTPARRPVEVRLAGRTRTLTADAAGVAVDLRGAVRRAHDAGRRGSFVSRGWRELSGGKLNADQAVPVAVDRRAVQAWVARLARKVSRAPVDAQLGLNVTSVGVTPSHSGRKLAGGAALERQIARGFSRPAAPRSFSAHTATVPPAVSTRDVWAQNPVILTVSHDAHMVRVFRHGQVVKTYRVAVGDSTYPTPRGRFTVQSKQVNPAWHVPKSDWAGALAGKTVPGGDPGNPLVARWIGFSGSVGFHGTSNLASLGQSASHGCVRMAPADVIDLYDRVRVGTTVLVGA